MDTDFTENRNASKFPENPMREEVDTEFDKDFQSYSGLSNLGVLGVKQEIAVALLTGGSDRPYVFGLTTSLISNGVAMDLIGSDELDFPEFRSKPGLNFLNLRGCSRPDVSFLRKVFRISTYYAKLIRYAATSKPKIFHILWNNKFELFDRTLLMLYYRLLRKRVVLTVHNVNARKRDSTDTSLNRLTLRIQYRMAHHIFVHTAKMKGQLIEEFGVQSTQVTVIPFGINNAVPNTSLTPADAKQRLGLSKSEKTILFFGRITPYKGLEYLIAAFRQVLCLDQNYRLIIAGNPDRCEEYWRAIREEIREDVQKRQVLLKANFIPDDETEVYFKAADVVVLPYRDIYQSGVLFLGHSFGLPVIAADVGSLKDEIVEGKTGFVFRPEDPTNLARVIEQYFESDLYANLSDRRCEIRAHVNERHSWDVVSQMTMTTYAGLLRIPLPRNLDRDMSSTSAASDEPCQSSQS
jgi:D-inositol-3-phosphate glycosyltransferase